CLFIAFADVGAHAVQFSIMPAGRCSVSRGVASDSLETLLPFHAAQSLTDAIIITGMTMAMDNITLRFLAEPTDVKFGGKVFGGSVMKWIDHAGYTCAASWSHSYCVTAYVGGIQFLRPIRVGDLVELKAEVIHTGNTSMHISVGVYARDPKAEEARLTTHCILVFVAVDGDGRPTPVPPYTPTTPQ